MRSKRAAGSAARNATCFGATVKHKRSPCTKHVRTHVGVSVVAPAPPSYRVRAMMCRPTSAQRRIRPQEKGKGDRVHQHVDCERPRKNTDPELQDIRDHPAHGIREPPSAGCGFGHLLVSRQVSLQSRERGDTAVRPRQRRVALIYPVWAFFTWMRGLQTNRGHVFASFATTTGE